MPTAVADVEPDPTGVRGHPRRERFEGHALAGGWYECIRASHVHVSGRIGSIEPTRGVGTRALGVVAASGVIRAHDTTREQRSGRWREVLVAETIFRGDDRSHVRRSVEVDEG